MHSNWRRMTRHEKLGITVKDVTRQVKSSSPASLSLHWSHWHQFDALTPLDTSCLGRFETVKDKNIKKNNNNGRKGEKKQAVDSKTLLKLDEWKKYLRKWIQPKKRDRQKQTRGQIWIGRKMCISKQWINREQKLFHFSDRSTHYEHSPNTKTHNLLQH